MIKRLIWTIWTPMSSVLKKADKLNLSLSLSIRWNLGIFSLVATVWKQHKYPCFCILPQEFGGMIIDMHKYKKSGDLFGNIGYGFKRIVHISLLMVPLIVFILLISLCILISVSDRYLHKNLTFIESFHSHLESMFRYREAQIPKLVSVGICSAICLWLPAWICNYIYYKLWDEITYPFPNFSGHTIKVWEWISNVIPHLIGHLLQWCSRWSLGMDE